MALKLFYSFICIASFSFYGCGDIPTQMLQETNKPRENIQKDIINSKDINKENENKEEQKKEIVYRRVNNSYSFSLKDFNDVAKVYKNIKSGDRVIFVVRHSERINNCTSEGGLTEYGIELAKGVGKKLQGEPFKDTSTDYYGSSVVKRTVQTSYYVGESRGSKVLKSKLNPDNRNEYEFVDHTYRYPDNSMAVGRAVKGEYFTDGHNDKTIYTFYEHHKEDVNKRSIEMITTLCKITEGHPFSWITSHDWVALPITERATDEKLSFAHDEWANFMQGVAVIVHPDGGWEVYPVKSLDEGKMPLYANPGC